MEGPLGYSWYLWLSREFVVSVKLNYKVAALSSTGGDEHSQRGGLMLHCQEISI